MTRQGHRHRRKLVLGILTGFSRNGFAAIVREGLLLMFEHEIISLCGETYRPTESVHRRAGSEMVTIQTTSGKESISKRKVREMLPSGLEREVKLKSYSEVKRRKGMFDEVLEAICQGASGRGRGQDAGRESQHGLRGLEGPQQRSSR